MVIITCLYLALVYLLFFKFKVLPWNAISQGLVVLIGTIILTGFLVGLQGLTPASTQAAITGRIVEIAPQVSGRVTSVSVEPNTVVEEGATLFSVDPLFYEARVEELEAGLALARLRLQQYAELAEARAGTEFQLQQTEAEVKQLEAQLRNARNDLANTTVRAPSRGMVPRLFLQPGMQVSPSRSVLTFVNTEDLAIVAQIQQKALQNIRPGDTAMVNFPALPGAVFESSVVAIPSAIGDAQVMASGQLPVIGQVTTTRMYPVYVTVPDDFPEELHKVGLAASVTIHTEGAGVVGIVAVVLQWVSTSMDAII
jgi:RND family efflux transporter MFP subunit